MEASVLPVGRAGSMVGFSQEFTCSQVNPLVPRETLYPQVLYDSSNAQPPENKRVSISYWRERHHHSKLSQHKMETGGRRTM